MNRVPSATAGHHVRRASCLPGIMCRGTLRRGGNRDQAAVEPQPEFDIWNCTRQGQCCLAEPLGSGSEGPFGRLRRLTAFGFVANHRRLLARHRRCLSRQYCGSRHQHGLKAGVRGLRPTATAAPYRFARVCSMPSLLRCNAPHAAAAMRGEVALRHPPAGA